MIPRRAAHLRHIADGGIAAGGRPAQHVDGAAAWRQQAENGAHQRRLAGAVRAEHADELAAPISPGDAFQHDPAAQRQAHIAEFDRVHGTYSGSARSTASSSLSIQDW